LRPAFISPYDDDHLENMLESYVEEWLRNLYALDEHVMHWLEVERTMRDQAAASEDSPD
jgi:hypothetical protein